jgi:uncharacterized caspase-like protein
LVRAERLRLVGHGAADAVDDGLDDVRDDPTLAHVPTAARFDQTAREDDTLGHGLFTYAMVEGLEGKGGIAQRREITTKSLADYVIKRVEELAKAQNASQEPQYFKGRDAEEYVLATW